jgi:membrane protease subunit (stomatin/prohibitin family)
MVGGGAYMLGKHAAQGQAQEEQQNAQIDQLQSQQAAPPPASGGISDDLVSQLEKLGKLKDEGVLTQDEFDAQKKKLLEAT